jgi:hypothetical protein
LIQELSGILEQNRQKRNAADAMTLGLQQGFQRAQAQKAQQGAAAGQAGYEASRGAGRAAQAASFGDSQSGYGGDRGNAYGMRDTQASAKTLSPSTSREGRLGLASRYAEAQGAPSRRESELLSKNPYTGSGYEFLPENDTPPSMTPDPALEEQKKRFTQNLMLSRGQTGGPMGGAGQPPTSDGLDPAVVNAVSRGGGPIGQMGSPMPNAGAPQSPASAPPMPTAAPGGWSQQDYDLLNAPSQRYPGG